MTTNDQENAVDKARNAQKKETLWTATLMDMLALALKSNKSDQDIIELLKELKQKKYKRSYVTEKIMNTVGEQESFRVNRLLNQI